MLYFKASEGIEILSEFKGEKGIFLKTFAMSDRRNKNGWRADWEGILKHIASFQENARPGIEYVKCDGTVCDLDHTDGTTKEQNVEVQEDFRVTTIVDHTLNPEDHKAFFIHKLEDNEKAAEFIEKVRRKEIEYVSPSIWPEVGGFEIIGTMPNGLPMIDVFEWEGLHDAFVTKPAFGDEAKITAICEGEDCHMKLLTASQLKADDNLAPLQQVPILIRHKDKLRFVSVSKCVAKKLQANLENDIAINEETLIRAISEAKEKSGENTSFSACSCSSNQMDDTKQKELESKLKAGENSIKELESKLKAMEEEKKTLESKLKAAEEDESDQLKNAKKAMDEKDEEVKTAKKAQEDTEKEKQNLEAKIKEPLIAGILENAKTHLAESQITQLETSLKAKSIEQIEEVIMMSNLSASKVETPNHFDFPGESAALTAKSLEETFEEAA